jgi:2-ketocyclohexanecarboxyl-CoA hydrolase
MEPENLLYQDLLYEVEGGVVSIAINRPAARNALRATTCEELIDAFERAARSQVTGVIVLTGAGKHAFCTDAEFAERTVVQRSVEELHRAIQDAPCPVIAKVRGYAIGLGNLLAAQCDLTLASETAIFGQAGPKMGMVDAGFGSSRLARIVGEKKAREMWFLCRRYPAREALAFGLVNAVVPEHQLDAEVVRWCAEILGNSPTALTIVKRAFNTGSEELQASVSLAIEAVEKFHRTDESQEGHRAVQEKRAPRFRKYIR